MLQISTNAKYLQKQAISETQKQNRRQYKQTGNQFLQHFYTWKNNQ